MDAKYLTKKAEQAYYNYRKKMRRCGYRGSKIYKLG